MTEKGRLVCEFVQQGQFAVTWLAVIDLQHVGQVFGLLGVQHLVVELAHHQHNALGLHEFGVEHHAQAFRRVFSMGLRVSCTPNADIGKSNLEVDECRKMSLVPLNLDHDKLVALMKKG